jgi:flagellar protein FlgJ
MTPEQSKTILEIATAAVACERACGCPAAVPAAQCIIESGWLKHSPGNNCFGIKAYAGCSGKQLLRTEEWFTDSEVQKFLAGADGRDADLIQPVQQNSRGAKRYRVRDWFATFETLGDCFAKRAAMFTAGRYAPFLERYKQTGDLEAFVRGFAPIYATDPEYADKVLRFASMPELRDAIVAVA